MLPERTTLRALMTAQLPTRETIIVAVAPAPVAVGETIVAMMAPMGATVVPTSSVLDAVLMAAPLSYLPTKVPSTVVSAPASSTLPEDVQAGTRQQDEGDRECANRPPECTNFTPHLLPPRRKSLKGEPFLNETLIGI